VKILSASSLNIKTITLIEPPIVRIKYVKIDFSVEFDMIALMFNIVSSNI